VVAAPAHSTAKVDDHPFVPRRRGQRDAFLRVDALGDQSRGDKLDPVADLSPGDARPPVVVGETERFGIRCGGDAVEEHPGDRRRPVLDLAYVGPLLVSAQVCHGASLGRPSPAGGRFGKASGTGTTLVFTNLPCD